MPTQQPLSQLPKVSKQKLIPKGAYKMTIESREEHGWVGRDPKTGKPVELRCWMYVFKTFSTEQYVTVYSYDTYDIGTPVIAWVEIRRGPDENHVMRSYNVCDRFQELRGGISSDPSFTRGGIILPPTQKRPKSSH